MHKKIKSIFFCLPFICGSFCFCFGIFNLFSSLLFFVGGYVALKHFLNYKKIRRRMHLSMQKEQVNGIKDMSDSSNSKRQSKDKKYSYRAENRKAPTENHGKVEESRVIQAENLSGVEESRKGAKVLKRTK